MTAVDTVEAEVRELVRRRGLDPVEDRLAMRQLIDEVVLDYDERALSSTMPQLPDPRVAAWAVYDAVAGFGPLQRHLDDPEVEESGSTSDWRTGSGTPRLLPEAQAPQRLVKRTRPRQPFSSLQGDPDDSRCDDQPQVGQHQAGVAQLAPRLPQAGPTRLPVPGEPDCGEADERDGSEQPPQEARRWRGRTGAAGPPVRGPAAVRCGRVRPAADRCSRRLRRSCGDAAASQRRPCLDIDGCDSEDCSESRSSSDVFTICRTASGRRSSAMRLASSSGSRSSHCLSRSWPTRDVSERQAPESSRSR